MAIVQEHFEVNGRDYIRTYSESGKYVVRDGVSYSEACDPSEYDRIYTEGDIMPVNEFEAEEIVSILTGGAS